MSIRVVCASVIAICLAGPASALTYVAVLEDDPLSGGDFTDVIYGLADSYADLLATNFSEGGDTTWVPPGAYDISGMAYDGKYRFVLELRDDAQSSISEDVIHGTIDTLPQLVATDFSDGGPATWVPPGCCDIRGMAYDGDFHVLLTDGVGAAAEVIYGSADEWEDIVQTDFYEGGDTGITLPNGFELAAFSYDGLYRLLLEETRDPTDVDIGINVLIWSFASMEDVIAGNLLMAEPAGWVPPGAYDIRGLAAVKDFGDGGGGGGNGGGASGGGAGSAEGGSSDGTAVVPLPGAGLLLIAALGAVAGTARRRSRG